MVLIRCRNCSNKSTRFNCWWIKIRRAIPALKSGCFQQLSKEVPDGASLLFLLFMVMKHIRARAARGDTRRSRTRGRYRAAGDAAQYGASHTGRTP